MNTTTQSKEKIVPPVVLPVDLRDYFAAKAMQSLLVADGTTYFNGRAKEAYEMADAMLKAREQS